MKYISTRGKSDIVGSPAAILNGIAPDGGLYVPAGALQRLDLDAVLGAASYAETAKLAIRPFFDDLQGDDPPQDGLDAAIDRAYSDFGAPVVRVGDYYVLELFHGPTLAFKDFALSLLPGLMSMARKSQGSDETDVILVATSGDTGKAALAAFENIRDTIVIVLYPYGNVSPVQELMMTTQTGGNTFVIGVKGDFDDAQRAVKGIFKSAVAHGAAESLGMRFSSANSINIGRLFPQIAYYFHAYAQIVRTGCVSLGEPIDIAVPTGNFGNILAGWYASRMGLPVRKFICASNSNNVLYDFLKTSRYDLRRKITPTTSPSMDITVSSNLERLLSEASGRNPELISALYAQLERTGFADIPESTMRGLDLFIPSYSTEADVFDAIREVREKYTYFLDPHTAVAWDAMNKFKSKSPDDAPALIVSTASAFKFPKTVLEAISSATSAIASGFELGLIDELSRVSGLAVPDALKGLGARTVRHNTVCAPQEIEETVLTIMKGVGK